MHHLQSCSRLAVLSTVVFSLGVQAQTPQAGASGPAAPDGPQGVPPGSVVLYDQLAGATNSGWTSQDFETGLDIGDGQLADDFVVTDAQGWDVTQVVAAGFNGGSIPASRANVYFYTDAASKPEQEVCSFLDIPAVNNSGTLEIDLPSTCFLAGPATYWVSVQARLDFGAELNQWYWYEASPQTGNPAQFRNPSDYFGTGCTDWGDRLDVCSFVSENLTASDQAFSLAGTVGPAGSADSRATFEVSKVFTDGNPGEVNVSLSCNTGLPLDQSKDISAADGVTFVVDDFDDGELDCTITEDGTAGYIAEYFDGTNTSADGCVFEDINQGDELSCRITNTPAPVDVAIEKVWSVLGNGANVADSVNREYTLVLYCDAEIVGGAHNPEVCTGAGSEHSHDLIQQPGCSFVPNQESANGLPGYYDWCRSFEGEGDDLFIGQVIPEYPDSSCRVDEITYDDSVESDASDCASLTVSAGQGTSCTVTNTVFFEGIPTLSQYGMAIMALLMLAVGLVGFRRFA